MIFPSDKVAREEERQRRLSEGRTGMQNRLWHILRKIARVYQNKRKLGSTQAQSYKGTLTLHGGRAAAFLMHPMKMHQNKTKVMEGPGIN